MIHEYNHPVDTNKSFEASNPLFGVVCINVCDDNANPVSIRLESLHESEEEAQILVDASQVHAFEGICNNGREARYYELRRLHSEGTEAVDFYERKKGLIGRLLGKKVLSRTVEYHNYKDTKGARYSLAEDDPHYQKSEIPILPW
jgi:hypothetical protein